MPDLPAIAITAGEPAGIGPELCAMLSARESRAPSAARLIVLGDRALLDARAREIGVDAGYRDYVPGAPAPRRVPAGAAVGSDGRAATGPAGDGTRAMPDGLEVWHHPLVVPARRGVPDPANSQAVIATLARGCDACATGAFAALVTAPVQKSAIQDAGIPFSGHTEFFAERTHTPQVVMLLVGGDAGTPLRVALATTHLALKDVPAAITVDGLRGTLAIVARELADKFGLAVPKVAVCGLNPHAGEGGHLGREEIDVIVPALDAARRDGLDVTGPFPADTVFVPEIARRFDAIVAMYHDQGLPVLKAASFGHGVNVTLGLPFLRTSVDHGTALDLAADPARARAADPGSLYAAVDLAIALAARRGA